jgi:hypothetical protein
MSLLRRFLFNSAVVLCFFAGVSRADPARGKENWVVSGEGFGRSFQGSVNVDRSLGPRWSLGGGVGSAGWIPSFSTYLNRYLVGEYASVYITAGLGAAVGAGYSFWYFWPGAGLEYRAHQGPTLRAALYLPLSLSSGLYKNDLLTTRLAIWPGFSLGWCF